MARRIKGFSADKGRLVKSIGYTLTKGGKVQPRRWYLGTDAMTARNAVERIKSAWDANEGTKAIDANGTTVKVWSETADPLAERPSISENATAPISMNGVTVMEAATIYLANIEARHKGGQVSHSYWVSSTFNLARGLDLLGKQKPLANIGAVELTTAVLALAARPLGKPTKGQKTTTQPISVVSARNYLAALKAFFDEMSKTESAPGSDQPLWRKPLRFEDIFRDNQPQLSATEKQSLIMDGGAEAGAFEISELRTLYSHSSDRQRLWMLLGLNCGFSSMELATLTVAEIHGLETDAPKIRRFRGKTNVYAEWNLWPETADYLRFFLTHDKRNNPIDLAILTDDRKPLIAPRGMGRRDGVRSAWVNVVTALNADRRLSFKFIRKTGARLVRMMPMGGSEVAEMYLAHADDKHGILNAYSGRSWEKLTTASNEMRRQIFDGWNAPARKIRRGKTVQHHGETHRPLAFLHGIV